ncbi:excisionase [Porcincola intestinalis]|uniref:Helix-turn-helix domain-containing protein n=1 Tax=Porcincola intestinalis TaxID=2606632 RepID=A0A6L5X1A4_9FIRM|nr:excisionase [Porcincola intestinalis]MSS14060.1 helix-turn-helix domain-containing protein [Porcincola intestinalis]
MSGCIWKFSDQIDDVDVEMLHRDFITFREAMEYYGLNEKPVVRLAREAGAVYKIGKMVRVRRTIFEAYLRRIMLIETAEPDEGEEGIHRTGE